MSSPFDEYEVSEPLRPADQELNFDLARALDAVVVVHAKVPEDAYTAGSLGVERLGNGVVIGADGLVLTIGYLITEAESVTLLTNDGREIEAHVLGVDQASGFGLVHALEPLHLPALPLGDSRRLEPGAPVVLAGGGGRAHALSGKLVARAPFAGYWEYLLDEALFTAPGHPHWSGAALIGPSGALMGLGSLQMTQEERGGRQSLINMCVPIELLPPILEPLSRGRQANPPRPWLGVFCQDAEEGITVAYVADGGPADRAEIRRGDIIQAVGEKPTPSLADFYGALWNLGTPGVWAPLRIKRGREVFDVEVKTGDRAAQLKRPLLN